MTGIGGLQFTASPFNGWYAANEIATRDFLDTQRYNLAEVVGKVMHLDMSNRSTFWMDRVSIELNVAVLHSFKVSLTSLYDNLYGYTENAGLFWQRSPS